MKRDEIANIGFQAANLLAARIKRMNQTDLITAVGVPRALGKCHV
jgi:hypothetical protein